LDLLIGSSTFFLTLYHHLLIREVLNLKIGCKRSAKLEIKKQWIFYKDNIVHTLNLNVNILEQATIDYGTRIVIKKTLGSECRFIATFH
jgi:hypothetical protein